MMLTKNWRDFYEVTNKTKNALVSEWKKENCFKDKNNLTKSGVIPEGAGLTSVLLMLVAFHSDKNIFPAESKGAAFNATLSDCQELVNASLKKLCEWTQTEFNAFPLLNKKSEPVFNENCGSTETVTWCLSSSILAIYAEKQGAIKLNSSVRESTLDMMARALNALIKGQREDGTWGFTCDGKGKRALYFTYIANASLADFFDYILDEISIVESGDDNATAEIDWETVNFLNGKLNIDTVAAVNDARRKLNKFLVEKCLPVLPELASCSEMSKNILDDIGACAHTSISTNKDVKYYYHNLYYTYYILEMLITSNADQYFKNTLNDPEASEALLNGYAPYLADHEQKYYKKHLDEFFYNFYEQALHSSRTNYLSASRTGTKFWESSLSELPLKWEHENDEFSDLAFLALDQSKATLTDPSILPMSLRTNVVYSFYVTERPEITIERLFNDICDNAYREEEDEERVRDLWDSMCYNLVITERSIESIIDFYDYLNKFEPQEEKHSITQAAPAAPVKIRQVEMPSAIDAAIEEKIAQYLRSEAGRCAISEAVGNAPAAQSGVAFDVSTLLSDETIDMVREICHNVNTTVVPTDDDPGNRIAVLISGLVDLYEALEMCRTRKIFAKKAKGGTATEIAEEVTSDAISYHDRYVELMEFIKEDLKEKKYAFSDLYTALKRLRNQ